MAETDWLSALGGALTGAGRGIGEFGTDLGRVWSTYINPTLKGVGAIAQRSLPYLETGAKVGLGVVGTMQGLEAMKQAKRQTKILERTQEKEEAIAALAAQAGGTLTRAGEVALTGGPLPAPLQAQADLWEEGSRVQIRDFMARAGISDSTMMGQFEDWISGQKLVVQAQLAKELYQAGIMGIQAATGPLGAAAGQAGRQTEIAGQALAEAQASIASLFGGRQLTEEDRRKRAQQPTPTSGV